VNLALPFPPAAAEESRVEKHAFYSRFLPGRRIVRVYLPPGYRQSSSRSYPVIYLHDGQNLFDTGPSGWHLQRVLDQEITSEAIPPLVAIGIDHGGSRCDADAARIAEYTFCMDAAYGGGRAAQHAGMLLEEIHPWAARHYRLAKGRQHVAIGGASLGALASLTTALEHPEIFGAVAAFSPSLWWNQEAIFQWARAAIARTTLRPRLWMDIGGREGSAPLDRLRRFHDHLRTMDWKPAESLRMYVDPAAEHHELAWSSRLGIALRYLFAP